jgi:hypothetical protein
MGWAEPSRKAAFFSTEGEQVYDIDEDQGELEIKVSAERN